MKMSLAFLDDIRAEFLRFAWVLLISVVSCGAEGLERQISLFNGKDLSGWDGSPGWWTVEDGALTSESTPDKPCKKANYLVWKGEPFANFQFDCEFKVSGQANSGIQIRSELRPEHDMFGYQADMTGDGKLIGYIYHHQYGLVAARGTQVVLADDGKRESRPLDDAAALLKHYKPGAWNHYRIVCKGSSIELYLNGVKMCDIADNHAGPDARKGYIGLQMHPGPPMKVQFKDLQIISFDSDVNKTPHNQKTQKP